MKRLLLFLMFLCAAPCFGQGAQGGSTQSPLFGRNGLPIAGADVAICGQTQTTGASVAANIATLTVGSATGYTVGSKITVAGFTGADTYFNGSFVVLATSGTTISFNFIHANASASTNGNLYQTGTTVTPCAPLTSIYTEVTLTNVQANPFKTDGLGNWAFWALPGVYEVQFYGATIPVTLDVIGIGGTSSGGGTVTGAPCPIAGVKCFGSSDYNVLAFGACGLGTSTTATVGASSSAVTLAAAIDFAGCPAESGTTGPGIIIVGAGPASTASNAGTFATANLGTAGMTSYTYRVITADNNGGWPTPPSTFTIATGPTTLAKNHGPSDWTCVNLTWVAGSWTPTLATQIPEVNYLIYRNGTYIGMTPLLYYMDCGQSATPPVWAPASAPTVAQNDLLETTIIAGAGTTSITLANASVAAVTGAYTTHSDTLAVRAAEVVQLANEGGRVYFPTGGPYNVTNLNYGFPGTFGGHCSLYNADYVLEGLFSPLVPQGINCTGITIEGRGVQQYLSYDPNGDYYPTAEVATNNISPVFLVYGQGGTLPAASFGANFHYLKMNRTTGDDLIDFCDGASGLSQLDHLYLATGMTPLNEGCTTFAQPVAGNTGFGGFGFKNSFLQLVSVNGWTAEVDAGLTYFDQTFLIARAMHTWGMGTTGVTDSRTEFESDICAWMCWDTTGNAGNGSSTNSFDHVEISDNNSGGGIYFIYGYGNNTAPINNITMSNTRGWVTSLSGGPVLPQNCTFYGDSSTSSIGACGAAFSLFTAANTYITHSGVGSHEIDFTSNGDARVPSSYFQQWNLGCGANVGGVTYDRAYISAAKQQSSLRCIGFSEDGSSDFINLGFNAASGVANYNQGLYFRHGFNTYGTDDLNLIFFPSATGYAAIRADSGLGLFLSPFKTPSINNILYVDGLTYTTVQAAVTAACSGGGVVIVPQGTYVGPTTFCSNLTIKAYNYGYFGAPTTFTYSAPLSIANLHNLDIEGIKWDFGSSQALTLSSISASHLDLEIQTTDKTAPVLTLTCSSTNNTAYNQFTRLVTSGGLEGIKFSGLGGVTPTCAVTENQFGFLQAFAPATAPASTWTAFDVVQDADSNTVSESHMYNLLGPLAAANGWKFNSSSLTTNNDTLSWRVNYFDSTSVTITGCGITGNQSSAIFISTQVISWSGPNQFCLGAGATPSIDWQALDTPNVTYLQAPTVWGAAQPQLNFSSSYNSGIFAHLQPTSGFSNGTTWTLPPSTGAICGVGADCNALSLRLAEGAAPGGVSATGILYTKSATHWLYMKNASNADSGEVTIPGVTGAITGGHCAQFVDAFTLQDNGSACGAGGTGTVTSVGIATITTGSQNFATTNTVNPNTTPVTTLTLTNVAAGHKFFMNNTGGAAAPDYQSAGEADLPNTTVFTDVAATFGAHLYDFSAATWKIPAAAGFTASAVSNLGWNTTSNNLQAWANAANKIMGVWTAAPTNGNCVQALVAGTNVLLQDSGNPCGTGTFQVQTGGVNNTSLGLNFTPPAAGPATIQPSNPGTNVEQFQIQNILNYGNAVLAATSTGARTGDYWAQTGPTATQNVTPGVTPNAQTANYGVLTGDRGKIIIMTQAAATTNTIPQANSAGFDTKFFFTWCTEVGSGPAKITPNTSSVNTFTYIIVPGGMCTRWDSDDTNYKAYWSGVPSVFALTDAATIAWDLGHSPLVSASLLFTTHGGSRTLNVTNPINGGVYDLQLTQDATGGEGLTLGTCGAGVFQISGGGGGAITLSTGVSYVDDFVFKFNGTNCIANPPALHFN